MPVKLPGCSNNSVKLYLRALEKKKIKIPYDIKIPTLIPHAFFICTNNSFSKRSYDLTNKNFVKR